MSGLFADKKKPIQQGHPGPVSNPARADFSTKAVSRAVLKATAQTPQVLYPLAIGILGGLAALLLAPSTLFIASAAAGSAIGLGAWLLDSTLRREKHAGDYLREIQQRLAGEVERSIQRLGQELREESFEQGLGQLERLRDKYEAFQELLRRKLNPEELTFSRFLGMTEQVFLAGLDNLTRMVDALKGINAIDESHIRRRLLELDAEKGRPETRKVEYEALSERLGLLTAQREKLDRWFTQNEEAMTQMDRIMAAMAEMDTTRPRAAMDMESAMEELKHLAARGRDYGRTAGL
ncbi:MAG: hypothetical protein A2514_13430 [Gammaproteobacteria bacterium RIFOXYD12_FULL_61_37]|nr:MAG: hypothetical protein A2514_13430 [Gammaproteobacteria bacterium RIFOXYD12_FULL_61_37]